MGGDHLHCFASEDESSTLDNDDDYSEISSYPSSSYRGGFRLRDEDESVSGSSGHLYKGFDDVSHGFSSNSVEFDGNLRRRKVAYNEIMRNYDELWARRECLDQAKNKILSYSPGAWINNAVNKKLQDYALPNTTSLLLVGPKGSGKSSLVNRISRVFEDDKFASERAQVTYNSSTEEGTFFLQEYMIPRDSAAFCLFDTRSLSEEFVYNDKMLQHWMMKGVRHGELVVRDSDSPTMKMSLKCKAQQSGTPSSEIRKVNFVVFVVNGLSVLRSLNSRKKEDRRYMEMVTRTFGCPYLSFKDDKPVIVVTHGDLLSQRDRARVRVYLGEQLGVPPAKQIFDIPDNSDPLTELTILDMIRYSLEHADKHMPCSESREWVDRTKFSVDRVKYEVCRSSILAVLFLAMLLGIACVAFPVHQSHQHNEPQEPLVTFSAYAESKPAINYSRNPKPLATSPESLPSGSAVDNQGYENRQPEATSEIHSSPRDATRNQKQENTESEHENQKPEVTVTRTLAEHQEQEEQEIKHAATSAPTLSSRPGATTSQPVKSDATSSPTPRLKSTGDCGHKSRSPSPRKRHPDSAVQWHKIRHLWLDE